MAVLNPEHLFEQAEKLIVAPPAGPPRQVDLRRAISSAYYGVFHFILTSAADEFVGVTKRSTPRYSLIYRSVDHKRLRDLCAEARKQQASEKIRRFLPPRGFGSNLQGFASALLELYEKRHSADYDPAVRVKTSDATLAIATARSAIRRYRAANAISRKTFLTLLLFSPR